MDDEAPPTPDPTLSTAIGLVDSAIERVPQFAGAWSVVRQAVQASMDRPAAVAPPADLGREARAVLERYTAATSDLEPSVDSAVGIGVAAIGALVGLAAMGVAALDRIGDQASDVSGHLRAIARTLSSANIEGWGGR